MSFIFIWFSLLPKSHKATQSNPGGMLHMLWASGFRNPEAWENRFFHSGLQASLPKLCIRVKPCLNILDDNQICPSLKKHYISQGCFPQMSLKDCSVQQAINYIAHKICRNARDPGRTGSPK